MGEPRLGQAQAGESSLVGAGAATAARDRRDVDAGFQPVPLFSILMTPRLLTLYFLAVIYLVSVTRFFVPWADSTRPLVQSLLFRVFRNPGEKAIASADGRLFFKQDV